MAVLWGISEDRIFWHLKRLFEDFRKPPENRGLLETVFGGCWWTIWDCFELGFLVWGVSPSPSGTKVPLALKAIHLLCCSLQLLMLPPVGFSPHTPYSSIAGGALSLNEETKFHFRGGVCFFFSYWDCISCYEGDQYPSEVGNLRPVGPTPPELKT